MNDSYGHLSCQPCSAVMLPQDTGKLALLECLSNA